MKNKKLIVGYLIASLIILCAWLSSDMSNRVISLSTVENPYDVQEQERIHDKIEEMRSQTTYTPENMLLLHDPYGTNTCSLYVYFKSETPLSFSYTIHVEEDGIPDYTNTISSTYSTTHEAQLIGLIPNTLNTITITLSDEQGTTSSYTTTYRMGSLKGEEEVQLTATQQTQTEQLSNGLYVLLGNDNEEQENFMYLYDNAGILRGELPLDDFRSHQLIIQDDLMYFSSGKSTIAAMNNLGQIVATYDLGAYELHHDYALDDRGNLLILADDTTKTTKEDQLISLNLQTGTVSLLIDFTEALFSYYLTASDPTSDTLDWLHLNTIQALGEGELLVSSRETSTILKLSHIYDEVEIDYMIAEDSFWEGSAYESLLLTKNGNFPSQSGQHTVTYMEDASLEDGQYYLIMFNNNFGYSKTRSSYDWSQIPDIALKTTDSTASSLYYCYLVDETKGTYELVDHFEVPYSPYISSVQSHEGNIIVDSGLSKILQEYDDSHTLLASFRIDSGNYVYRIFKYTFDGFYFNK